MTLFTDVRLTLRRLAHAPGYAATAVLTFALAIGANSAIFSVVRTVLLRPSPVAAPADLAVLWQTDTGGQAVIELTYRHLREWTAAGTAFTQASVMGSHNWNGVLQGRGDPSRIWFSGVSAGFFDTVGVRPMLGRALRPEDDVPNAPAVAVLNHDTWVRRFGSDPNIVGTTMTLDNGAVAIVGVMPPGFDVPHGAEFWVPVVPALASGTPPRTTNLDAVGVFYVVGRVRPGLDAAMLRTEVDAVEARLDRAEPGRLKWGARTVVTPFLDFVFGPVRPALRALWAAVAVLLLIACANVSGLLLTRVSRRRHEHAVRLALGATRRAIGRAWATEIVLLAAAGGMLGLGIAQWLTRIIVVLAPDDVPRNGDVGIDGTVAFFTFAAVALVALVTGAMPLRDAGQVSLLESIEGERLTAARHTLRARSALLVVQIGLSVVLLVAAGLVVRSVVALGQVDLGFAPARVLSLTVQPGQTSRPANLWLNDLLTRVRALPGVESAGAVYLRPLMLGPIGQGVRITLDGQPATQQSEDANPTLNYQVATPGYFETMRVPLVAGRDFTERDTAAVPRVAIVSASTARRLWPGQDPIGKRVSMATFTRGKPGTAARTIVGVVSDVRYRAIDEVQLDVYDPALQVDQPADNVLVRTAGDPRAAISLVRAATRDLDPSAIVDVVTTMDAVVGRAQAPWRLTMWMFVLFAALAFGLAALGLFSLVALDVSHRRKEFAIRLALGASRAAILRGVLARAGWRVFGGLVLGLSLAVATGRAMRRLLFGVPPDDAVTYGAVLAVVLIVVAAAAYLAARRAGTSDPQVLLRQS